MDVEWKMFCLGGRNGNKEVEKEVIVYNLEERWGFRLGGNDGGRSV